MKTPISQYRTAHAQIAERLAEIQAIASAQAAEHHDNARWGQVGDAKYLLEQLNQIADRLARRGEYA